MELSKIEIVSDSLTPFQSYLLSNAKVKLMYKEFDFYNIVFYKEERTKRCTVSFQYPKGNMYWYLDFEKYIYKHFLDVEDDVYHNEWADLLARLKEKVKDQAQELKAQLKYGVTAHKVVKYQCLYNLRDYQAYDLLQFLIKYRYWGNRGLILSEPRTGKSRVALAAALELATAGSVVLVICPKSAEIGWSDEINKMNSYWKDTSLFNAQIVTKISDLKTLQTDEHKLNIRVLSYDIFKKFTVPQIRQLTSKSKEVLLLGDEIHRLRNFKTQQSKAIFDFKEFCIRDDVDLGIIGVTGTPAVKESTDIFGLLSLINESKIQFKPFYNSFNCFKEYFYYCEDTSYGKITKALRREHELNFIVQTCSVQTKQIELSFFQNYTKEYRKVELDLDEDQRKIYDSVYETMEYDEDIDCQNKLVQLVRLQQICIDPFGLVATYERASPKIKWVVKFTQTAKRKFIVACKKTTPLKHLMEIFDKLGLKYTSILGKYTFNERLANIDKYRDDPEVKVLFLQLDTGREALTLPMAHAIVFLDRDFAQGFNEQAEARMTPIDGSTCTKYVVDLVMKNTKEEEIYNTLVVKKQSINAINTVFKSKKEEN